MALRAEINEGAEVKVSVNDLVVKAAAVAHEQLPDMNVTWTDEALRRWAAVDIAVAVATDRGLMTPVVRDVGSLTVTRLASTVRDLAGRARDGRLKQDELEGGSLSVTNLGMHGVEEFAAIINPPQAAILAVGAIEDRAVALDGEIVARPLMTLTLTCDHRTIDGATAADFLRTVKEYLEEPGLAL
jgi:pyruvate dehydrogenase E2 component (dihydrolipoamide acetyltransferase)